MQARAAAHAAVAANLRDIIARQKSIAGFWFAPSKGFAAKQAEVRQLEARVAMLRVGAGLE